MILAYREHEFCYGHMLTDNTSKCHTPHGHNGLVKFTVSGELNSQGMVLDFSIIKEKLCQWLEDNWDHRFLVSRWDERANFMKELSSKTVILPFNPTAENLAKHLLNVVGPDQLIGTGAELIKVDFYETSKCGVSVNV